MDNNILDKKLDEIIAIFGPEVKRPKSENREQPQQTPQQPIAVRPVTDANLQEKLDYVRVCVKYLAFNSDASERERNYFKALLNDKS